MGVTRSTRPLGPRSFGYDQARHLLNRAGFGGTPRQIVTLQAMGLDKAVDSLVDYHKIDDQTLAPPNYDADIIRPPTRQERQQFERARRENDAAAREAARLRRARSQAADRQQMAGLRQWWLRRMIATPRPLEEKLVLLWHSHFASNHRTVRDSFLMLKQNAMFRRHANDSFAALAMNIVRDPAMIRFLNNDSNNKDHPNENLARELMELFTLGEGNYTENDIKQGARALTGYTARDNDFVFRQNAHDAGAKTILGKRGRFNGDDFVRILLAHRQCAAFVAYKLYRHFVSDMPNGPDPAAKTVIRKLAQQLYARQYQIAPVLKTLFKSEHFYDPAIVGNLIKSPAQLVVGTVRGLQPPDRDAGILDTAMNMMGQRLFDPPSVAGWDGGRSWINTSTLFVRQNLCAYLISGKLPFKDGWSRNDVNYDPGFLVKDLPAPKPAAVTDHLIATLLGDRVAPQRREQLIGFLSDRGGPINRDTLIATLLLITAMPEYQLC